MARLNTENLFLLEFLIDDLNLQSKCNCTSPGEVCVSFQFLDNAPMDVCEGDFNGETSNKFGESGTTSKTGKSCLFSLAPSQAQRLAACFNIIVSAFKKMPTGWEPSSSFLGSASISVLPLYLELIQNPELTTSAKVIQETHNLLDANGVPVGNVSVYIRLSCYGKMIITQFEMNLDDNSVLFRGKDGQSMYRYKKTKKGKTTKIEDLSRTAIPGQFANPNCPTQACFPGQSMDQFTSGGNRQEFSNFNCPTQPCFPGQSMAEMQQFGRNNRQVKSACAGGCRRN